MWSNFKFNKIILLMASSFLLLPLLVNAQVLPPCTATGNCGICDFAQGFVNIIRWVFGVIGSTALFFLIWHGFSWLTAAGNKEKVEAGRKGLMHTTLGLLIILGAWLIINITLTLLLTPAGETTPVQTLLFSGATNKWYEFCGGPTMSGDAKCAQGWGEGTPCGDGKFCLRRGEVNPQSGQLTGIEMSCDYTSANGLTTYDNACHYWAMHPSRSEYKNYYCTIDSNNCQYGKVLGSDYCTTDEATCCEPKQLDATIIPYSVIGVGTGQGQTCVNPPVKQYSGSQAWFECINLQGEEGCRAFCNAIGCSFSQCQAGTPVTCHCE